MTPKARIDFGRVAFQVCLLLMCARCWVAAATDDPSPFGVGSSAQASGAYAAWMPRMAAAGVKWVRVFPECYHFSFDSDSTNYSRYYLQQVTVTNLTPRPTTAPTGFIVTPGVGQVALKCNRLVQ